MTGTDNQSTPAPSSPGGGKLARWVVIMVLSVLLVAACILGYLGWTSTDTKVPEAGYVALVFGVVFSLLVGAGLMALVFYSSRKGYDEPVVLIQEPESEPDSDPDDGRAPR
jgi:flagellar basal body-associated protein FliL